MSAPLYKQELLMLNNPRKDIPLIVTSLLCIILIALAFSLFPQQSSQMAETILVALPGYWDRRSKY